ncbi:MAG: hypothetical protein K1X64_18850 [Myxococcaceae bacterium]|nr:hypothetical protein [Myxococcaceae bacterium]
MEIVKLSLKEALELARKGAAEPTPDLDLISNETPEQRAARRAWEGDAKNFPEIEVDGQPTLKNAGPVQRRLEQAASSGWLQYLEGEQLTADEKRYSGSLNIDLIEYANRFIRTHDWELSTQGQELLNKTCDHLATQFTFANRQADVPKFLVRAWARYTLQLAVEGSASDLLTITRNAQRLFPPAPPAEKEPAMRADSLVEVNGVFVPAFSSRLRARASLPGAPVVETRLAPPPTAAPAPASDAPPAPAETKAVPAPPPLKTEPVAVPRKPLAQPDMDVAERWSKS